MARYVDCPECQGWGGTDQTCSTCSGAGQVLVDDSAAASGPGRAERLRRRLSGKGFVVAGLVALVVLVGLVVLIVQSISDALGPGILDDGASRTTWQGSYECTSGPAEIVLALDVADGSSNSERDVTAEIWYLDGPDDERSGDPDSTALGTLDGVDLNLVGEDPEGAPPHQLLVLNATVGPEADVILGQVTSAACETLAVTPLGSA